ncbi:hypothetical protein [Promicromonospora panici]|uniref:hypothetical protein n=1 Tax=Promicromonospora panici TaxID=2219658 RepID=UPI00101B8CC9|nr:hypothetical protein [Promicromonospora panici]
MNVTRVARPSLADPRRGLAGVLTVMFLVFAVLAVQAVCGVHRHAADHSGTSADGAVGQQYAAVAAQAVPDEAVPDEAAHAAPERPGQDPYDCAEDRPITARSDRTVSPSTDLAGVPALAVQWLVPAVADHGTRTPSGLAAATAPSLHALGISRT